MGQQQEGGIYPGAPVSAAEVACALVGRLGMAEYMMLAQLAFQSITTSESIISV